MIINIGQAGVVSHGFISTNGDRRNARVRVPLDARRRCSQLQAQEMGPAPWPPVSPPHVLLCRPAGIYDATLHAHQLGCARAPHMKLLSLG
jgi:hypothetical protein